MKIVKASLVTLLFCLSTIVFAQKDLDKWVTDQMPKALAAHNELVSIPNDANYPKDMDKNVDWLDAAFKARGFKVDILETPSIPIVVANRIVDESLPTVLFYFHFDGQPVDPTKWFQEHPFKPVIKQPNDKGEFELIGHKDYEKWNKEWRIFARAAADDKGPITMFLQALTIMDQQGIQPAYNIKVLLDGEEELSSGGLKATLDKYKTVYKADRLIIMDGPAHTTNRPTLTFGCRGITSAVLTVYGPKVPQHSGHFGNYAPNPAFRMANLLASMKDKDGRVKIKGFYKGIKLDKKTKAILAAVPDDEAMLRGRLGIAKIDNVGKNYQESLQYPSLNVRGMASAWIGKQTRTIVPGKAVVQLGIRLVQETDGTHLMNLVENHIKGQGYHIIDREPTDAERLKYPLLATFKRNGVTTAFRTDLDSPTGKWLTGALEKVFNEPPVRIRTMGGTIPVTPIITTLNIPAVIVPMVNMDNNQHSPNENLRVGNLYDGIKTCFGILTEKM